MANPFDHISFSYTPDFTETFVQQLQRRYVWKYLEKITPELNGLDILELNCGSGDDALLFDEEGFNLIATDISEITLRVTEQAAAQISMRNRVCSHYIDPEDFDETVFDKKFSLIFVNFDGLNSIPPKRLQHFFQKIPSLLSDRGRFVAIITPRLRFRETIHFLIRLRFKRAFESIVQKYSSRLKNGVTRWLHTPQQIKRWTKKEFKLIAFKPAGYFWKYSLLNELDDNFLIDLQLK